MPDDARILELSELPEHDFDSLARDVGDCRRGPRFRVAVTGQVKPLGQGARLAVDGRASGARSMDLGCFGEAA